MDPRNKRSDEGDSQGFWSLLGFRELPEHAGASRRRGLARPASFKGPAGELSARTKGPAGCRSSRTTMGGRPLELDTFWTPGDISDLEAARTQRLLTLPEPVSPADHSPWPAEFSFPKPSPVGMTPDVKKIAEQAAAAWSREQKRGRQARRKDSKPAADPAALPTTVTDIHKAVTTMFRPGP